MASYSTEALRSFCDDILVASGNPEHDVFGDRRVEDRYVSSGPLAGLYAGLSAAKTNDVLVLSCDVPMITSEIIGTIASGVGNFDARVASCNGRIHPLIGCYRKSALPTIERSLESGQLKLRDCLDAMNVDVITFPPSYEAVFKNINAPNDVSLWEEV
jgi:molybdopterin-guanine dinucleotide biosynthesis protein A